METDAMTPPDLARLEERRERARRRRALNLTLRVYRNVAAQLALLSEPDARKVLRSLSIVYEPEGEALSTPGERTEREGNEHEEES
jgi:hypothetical protein